MSNKTSGEEGREEEGTDFSFAPGSQIELEPEDFCNEEMMRNLHRNRTLIDLDYIPKELVDKCILTFNNTEFGDRKNLLNYFIKYRLKSLMENIGDF